MRFRLVCIFEKVGHVGYKLRVEVCNDVGRMPPFLHNLKLDDVFRNVNYDQKKLACILFHSGCSDISPFVIENRDFLLDTYVQSELRKCPYIYLMTSPRGSLRKGKVPFKEESHKCPYPQGQIIGKELYIHDIKKWQTEIDTRFRLNGVLSLIPTGSTFNCPIVQAEGSLVSENSQCAVLLTKDLGEGYCPDSSVLNLGEYQNPSKKLQELLHNGWELYVPKQTGEHVRAYSHTSPSGIPWFSTEKNVSEEIFSNKMLECFLRSRNYSESDGTISIFNFRDVSSGSDKEIAVLAGATQSVLNLYSQHNTINMPSVDAFVNKNVNARLRPYQLEGVRWLQQQRWIGAGCLLADEMGLGKTLQVIAHLSCINTDKPHLVIAPVSLLYNWHNEICKFAPRLLEKIVVTSYDHIRIHLQDFLNIEYDTIVIDEAQVIKNRETQKYKAIAKLRCVHKIILTGTPIENSIEDIWSHFIMLNPDMIHMYNHIRGSGMPFGSAQNVCLSAKLLNRFIRRKTKQEVLNDLPERSEENIYLALSEEERLIYDNLYKAVVISLNNGLSGRVNSIVLEGLLRLRQACVSANTLPASLRLSRNIESTKLKMAVNFAERIKLEGRKVLIFSQFVSSLRELEGMLAQAKLSFVKLYGNTINRKAPVEDFQNDNSITVFLISLKSGGVGLNLTAADTVILLDDWWNPAVEEQAIGRSHRIGQQRNVFIYRLICKNTIEEKIIQLQEKKRATINIFENTSSVLDFEGIKNLLTSF